MPRNIINFISYNVQYIYDDISYNIFIPLKMIIQIIWDLRRSELEFKFSECNL